MTTVSRKQFEYNRDKAAQNLRLRILENAAQDDRVIAVLGEMARLIRASEQVCENAAGCTNYDDAICDDETANIEEAIGVAFLILQMKIRRVVEAAKISILQLDVMRSGRNYGGYPHCMVRLIWEVANYYKHREEWSAAVWDHELKQNDPELYKQLRGQIRTREVVECLGIVGASTGNLRTALEGLGVSPYSDCKNLAAEVETWAEQILSIARNTTPGNGNPDATE